MRRYLENVCSHRYYLDLKIKGTLKHLNVPLDDCTTCVGYNMFCKYHSPMRDENRRGLPKDRYKNGFKYGLDDG